MRVLVFPSQQALEVALRTGLVPDAAQRAPARVGVTGDGEVEVATSAPLPATARRALEAAGARSAEASASLAEVSCLAEALPARWVGVPDGPLPEVLLTVRDDAGLLDVCGELLRLGCERQQLRLGGPGVHGLVRVLEPPWYVVSRALDGLDGVRAFVPASSGQQAVWVQLGWQHPLGGLADAAGEGPLLVTARGAWERVPPGPWFEVGELLAPVGLPEGVSLPVSARPPRVQVRLRLGRATRAEAPTLFVLERGLAAVEALVRSTPEAQLNDVLFALTGETVVLRARPGREAAASALPGAAHVRAAELSNLFAPAGTAIEPPLDCARLRAWLAPDPDEVSWLSQGEAGLLRQSLPDAAFRPLSEWVEYVVDRDAGTLRAWAASATFDFEPFVALEDVAPAPTAVVERPAPEATAARPRPRPQAPAAPRAEAPLPQAPESATPAVAVAPRSPTESEAQLAREEAAFVALEAPADSSERTAAWGRLAEAYARAQRPRDCGMAWAQALWEASGEEAATLARRWAETSGVRLEGVLAQAAPEAEQTRGAVAHLLAASAGDGASALASRAPEWAAFLQRFGDDLDVRSFWLGQVAVSRLSGGDALGLARARDRVLARLQGGLSLDRDVLRLLRLVGQGAAGGAGGQRAQRVASQLESLLKAFDETPRKRSAVEAPVSSTRAYVRLVFAWGLARLAQAERARALREEALGALDLGDVVHGYAARAYAARVEQALEGVSPETPLPAAVAEGLTRLDASARYKVDRLRHFSQILEPQEHVDAFGGFFRTLNAGGRGEELSSLRALRDASELVKAIEARLDVAAQRSLAAEERARLIDGLLDFLPQLPESQALPLLQRALGLADGMEARHRALVLEDALKIAGHFGRAALVKQLVLQIGSAISELGAEGVGEIGQMLVAGVRSLRRVGLRDEAGELLSRAAAALKGDGAKTLEARLGLASGFAYLGAMAQAQPIIDEVQARLGRESGLTISDRMRLSRAAARALSNAPTEVALAGLSRLASQLPFFTDSFNTNSHFCLSLVDFADALVLGHVGDDLSVNEATRRLLDEDEYLVRRRVHRDVGGQA